MAKFLFVVPPLIEQCIPTIILGKELLKRQHQVYWTSLDETLTKIIPNGGEFINTPTQLSLWESEELQNQIQELQKNAIYGIASLVFLYNELLIPINSFMYPGVLEIIDDYKPDIIIADHQAFSGSLAAAVKNIPYVTSIVTPSSIDMDDFLPNIYEWKNGQIIKFQNKVGINSNKRIDISPCLNLVYTSKIFFGKRKFPKHYQFIGPIKDERIPIKYLENDEIKVLIDIGNNFNHAQKQDFFIRTMKALGKEKIKVILISDPELFDEIPENFIIEKELSSLDLIPYMQAVICNGKHTIVSEALYCAIPVVVIPLAYDQLYIAERIIEHEAGIRLKFNNFRPDYLKKVVKSVLEDNKYKIGAKKIQQSFLEAGGITKAIQYLEKLLTKSSINIKI